MNVLNLLPEGFAQTARELVASSEVLARQYWYLAPLFFLGFALVKRIRRQAGERAAQLAIEEKKNLTRMFSGAIGGPLFTWYARGNDLFSHFTDIRITKEQEGSGYRYRYFLRYEDVTDMIDVGNLQAATVDLDVRLKNKAEMEGLEKIRKSNEQAVLDKNSSEEKKAETNSEIPNKKAATIALCKQIAGDAKKEAKVDCPSPSTVSTCPQEWLSVIPPQNYLTAAGLAVTVPGISIPGISLTDASRISDFIPANSPKTEGQRLAELREELDELKLKVVHSAELTGYTEKVLVPFSKDVKQKIEMLESELSVCKATVQSLELKVLAAQRKIADAPEGNFVGYCLQSDASGNAHWVRLPATATQKPGEEVTLSGLNTCTISGGNSAIGNQVLVASASKTQKPGEEVVPPAPVPAAKPNTPWERPAIHAQQEKKAETSLDDGTAKFKFEFLS